MKSFLTISQTTTLGAGIGFFAGAYLANHTRDPGAYIDFSGLWLFVGPSLGAGTGFLIGLGIVLANKTLNYFKNEDNSRASNNASHRLT